MSRALPWVLAGALVACGAPPPKAIHLDLGIPSHQSARAVVVGRGDFVLSVPVAPSRCGFYRIRTGDTGVVDVTTLPGLDATCGSVAGANKVVFAGLPRWGEKGPVTLRLQLDVEGEPAWEARGSYPAPYPGALYSPDGAVLWQIGGDVNLSTDAGRTWETRTPPGFERGLFIAAQDIGQGRVMVASDGLYVIDRLGAKAVDTGGVAVRSIHGSVLTGIRGESSVVGRRVGERVEWEELPASWGKVAFAWRAGNTLRVVTRVPAKRPRDVRDGPVYRVLRDGESSWREVRLPWAVSTLDGPPAVDDAGNALIPRILDGAWFLPVSD